MDTSSILILVAVVAGGLAIGYAVARIAGGRARRDSSRPSRTPPGAAPVTDRTVPNVAALIGSGRLQEAMDLLMRQGDHKGAARVAMRMQKYARAAELFERSGDLESAANALLRVPDVRRAAEVFSRAKNHDRAAELLTQVGDLWGAAEEMVAAGRLDHAARIYRHLGHDSEAHRLSARALRKDGRFPQAAEAFEAARDLMNAAECWAQAGMLRESAQAYHRAGRPDLGAALLEKAGLGSEAAALYEEAGDHAHAAQLYSRIQDPDREIQALAAAGHLLEAGRLAYQLGRREQAEEILKMSTSADRGYARTCYLLGRILSEQGRNAEAVRYYAQFVERVTPTEQTRQAFEHLVGFFSREQALDPALRTLRRLDSENLLSDPMRFELQRLEDAQHLSEARPAQPVGQPRGDVIPPGLPERYTVSRRLGEGGTAIVYLARDSLLQRDVVLKFLSNPNLPDDVAEEYFMREARIVAGLSHAAIVQVFDVGHVSGRHYMVMEFIDGDPLDRVLDRAPGRMLPLERVSSMASTLADALAYAHARKVIHRDIKPGNVMVLPDGQVKLMDFGMAKALEVHRDRSLYICGTPDYMSPEQEAGYDLTPATDIYSFGLLMTECLLGPLPSGPSSVAARLARLRRLEQSTLPVDARSALRACLDVEISARPASALDVAAALRRSVAAIRGELPAIQPEPKQEDLFEAYGGPVRPDESEF